MKHRDFEHQFEVLYLPLGMYALRIVDDIEVARDLAQDAFVKAWEVIEAGGEIQNLKAWVYRTVRNLAIDYLRTLRQTVELDRIPEPEVEIIDTSERDAAIWRAIDKLPERCREIFLMSKRDGLTDDEIAAELGLSSKTVRNQLTKAFQKLRDTLTPYHKPFFLPFL